MVPSDYQPRICLNALEKYVLLFGQIPSRNMFTLLLFGQILDWIELALHVHSKFISFLTIEFSSVLLNLLDRRKKCSLGRSVH